MTSVLIGCSRERHFGHVHVTEKVIAEVARNEGQRFSEHDNPSRQAEFFASKRLPPSEFGRENPTLPVERYAIAINSLDGMAQYSTALRRRFPSKRAIRTMSLSHAAGLNNAVGAFIQPGTTKLLGTWVPLGPGNVGGRIRALLIDPKSPDTMYLAAASGGVWKSTDAGGNWSPIADKLVNIDVNALAIDPHDSKVLYAGTGEGYFNFDAARGDGIFKSSDAGLSWAHLTATKNPVGFSGEPDFAHVQKIVVSTVGSSRIYAATGTGIQRSLNGGQTWTRVLDATKVSGCTDLATQAVSGVPYVFASCGNFAQGAIYRERDTSDVQTWPRMFQTTNMGRTSLAIAPSQQNVIYALSASLASGTFKDGLLGVFRSTANGDPNSWTTQTANTDSTKLNTVLLSNPANAFGEDCGFPDAKNQFLNQGWYDNTITVDPKSPDIVWVGGIDLFRSDDAGKNWGVASYWWMDPGAYPQYVHADQHNLVFHPQYDGVSNRTLFVSNDGGVFVTNDARATVGNTLDAVCGSPVDGAVGWTRKSGKLSVTQFYWGSAFPDGARYFGGTQDNGTVMGNDQDGADKWLTIQGGDGGYVALDPNDTNTLYAAFTQSNFTKSIDGGKKFTAANDGLSDGRFLFITPFVLDPSSSNRLWTGGDRMYRSDVGAAHWVLASNPFDSEHYPSDNSGVMSAIAVAATDPNTVLAGFAPSTALAAGGGWIHSTSEGTTSSASTVWPRVRPRLGWVSSIAIDPTNPSIAYATYSSFNSASNSGHVWKSVDRGATWTVWDGSGGNTIPDIPVHVIVIDPTDSRRLFLGTDLGVFTSLDGGLNWNLENTGFPNVITESLVFNSGNPRRLFAFTHGRGVWRVDLAPTNILNGAVK